MTLVSTIHICDSIETTTVRQFIRCDILIALVLLLWGGQRLDGADKWTLAADPPAATAMRKGLDGKTIEISGQAAQDIVLPATGATVLLTGHATGSTTRDVWSLSEFSKLGTLTGRFDTSPGSFALSPDGQWVATIRKKNFSSQGAEVWSVSDGKKGKFLELGPAAEPVLWSGFSAPSTLLTLHADEQGKTKLRRIDVTADQPAKDIAGPQNVDPRLIHLSPGGHLLAVVLKDGSAAVLDLREGQASKLVRIPAPQDFGKWVGVRFSPDGTELDGLFSNSEADTAAGNLSVAAWNLSDGQLAVQLQDVRVGAETEATAPAMGEASLVAFDWLPDGSALLIGNKTLIDRDTGHVVWRLKMPAASFGRVPLIFLGTDHLLVPRLASQPAHLAVLKLPWPQIDSGLKALQAKSPAWLRPGDKLSLQFEFGGLRFKTADQVKGAIAARLTARLQEEGFAIGENQPVTLKVAYAESAGTTLQKRSDGFPFGPPRFRPPPLPRLPRPRDMADEATGTGTAFVINSDGYLLTCAHVVGSAASVQVKIGEKAYHGRVIAKNVGADFALLKVEVKNLTALPLSDSARIELGEEVRAFGYPISTVLGESIKATRGTLAGIVKQNNRTLFQVDASINPGNSGGPLVNDLGEVVGINSAKLVGADVDNVGFSIPINDVKSMLQEQKIKFETKGSAGKLTGPELIKRVTPAVAFVTSAGGTDVGPASDGTVVVTRIACLVTLLIKDHPDPVWSEQIVVEPHQLRVQGELTEEKARDMAFESFTKRLETLSPPYFISKDAPPITLPVVTDLTNADQQLQPVSAPRKTKRGLAN